MNFEIETDVNFKSKSQYLISVRNVGELKFEIVK